MSFRDIAKNAQADYALLTDEDKQAARNFFEEMDADHNEHISTEEFMDFLEGRGFQRENLDWLFQELDENANGTLDFQEVVTFIYMLSRQEYRELINAPASTEPPRGQRRPGDQRRRWDWDSLVRLFDAIVDAFHSIMSLAGEE